MPDVLTPAQRSYCMSRIRGKDTSIEILVRSALHKKGYRFRKHVNDLPGRPDVVLTAHKLVIFIDGDFWHGRRFDSWKRKLTPHWRDKISKNIKRDQSNFRRLRYSGWKVVRIWESQIKKNFDATLLRITKAASNED